MADDDRDLRDAIDPKRLARSQSIVLYSVDEDGHDLPARHYLAVGGDSKHYLHTSPHLHCDCEDFSWHGHRWVCKHLLAALVEENDQRVIKKGEEIGIL